MLTKSQYIEEEIKRREDRNKLLADWCTAIFGIFWSVWWAGVADAVLKAKAPVPVAAGLSLSGCLAAVIMAAYVGFFCYYYVKWQWSARVVHWDMGLRDFCKLNWALLLVVAGILVASYALFRDDRLSWSQFAYGAVLTVGWVLTVLSALLNSKGWV